MKDEVVIRYLYKKIGSAYLLSARVLHSITLDYTVLSLYTLLILSLLLPSSPSSLNYFNHFEPLYFRSIVVTISVISYYCSVSCTMAPFESLTYSSFSGDVPTAQLFKVSLQKLLAADGVESDALYEFCKTFGFFLLDLTVTP